MSRRGCRRLREKNVMSALKPVIGVPTDHRLLGSHWFHCVGDKYVAAVTDGAGATAMPIPASGGAADLETLLSLCDGILLTGSPSNVEPHRYAGTPSVAGTWHDPRRDEVTLSLIPRVVESGIPLLAICRGMQELNVAYGGTLHQRIHELEGCLDHREKADAPVEDQYGAAHEVEFVANGQFAAIAGRRCIRVNSLHSQGIDRLGDGLVVEGRAPDGIIEAIAVKDARAFALGTQWHPEWRFSENDFSKALFAAFGAAVLARAEARRAEQKL
jgi:putative glutamine amidotransferase